MNILGFYGRTFEPGRWANVHDAGASLFIDGRHQCSIQAERLTRVKEEDRFPQSAIDAVLGSAGLKPEQVDLVGVAHTPEMVFLGRENVVKRLASDFPRAKYFFISHHNAHASATFFASRFDQATVLSFDNGGDLYPLNLQSRESDVEKKSESEKMVIGLVLHHILILG